MFTCYLNSFSNVQEQRNSLHPSLLLFFQILSGFNEHHFLVIKKMSTIFCELNKERNFALKVHYKWRRKFKKITIISENKQVQLQSPQHPFKQHARYNFFARDIGKVFPLQKKHWKNSYNIRKQTGPTPITSAPIQTTSN
jgi:hypothetical protein